AAARRPHRHRPAALRTGVADLDLRARLLRRRRRQVVLQPLPQLRRDRLGTLALRVGAARQERPPEARLDDHGRLALLALDAGIDRLLRVALGVHVHDALALGVAGAAQERPALALAQHHRLAALLADVLRRLCRQDRLAVLADVHDRLALGVA